MPQELRDSVFRSLKHEPENLTCFQCGNKNPKWASVTMGLLICYNCTTLHRSLGTHISFVRSSELDKWSRRQLAFMENGGNRRAKEFFRRHGHGTQIDYSSSTAERYRVELDEKVSKLYPKRKEESSDPVPEIRLPETVKLPEPPKPVETLPSPPKLPETKEVSLPPAPNKSTVIHIAPVVPTSTPTFKFRKTKASAPPAQFKPVMFRPEEEEFQECNPVPASPPAEPHQPTPPIPAVMPSPPIPAKPAVAKQGSVTEKKGFGSEDFQLQVDAYTRKERMTRFSGAKAISSDAYFGRDADDGEPGALGVDTGRLAEMATEKAYEVRAMQLKDKAVDLYNALASRFAS